MNSLSSARIIRIYPCKWTSSRGLKGVKRVRRTRTVHLLVLLVREQTFGLHTLVHFRSSREYRRASLSVPFSSRRDASYFWIFLGGLLRCREARTSRSRLLSLLNARVAGKLFNYFTPRCFSLRGFFELIMHGEICENYYRGIALFR